MLCTACDGTGLSPAGRVLDGTVRGLLHNRELLHTPEGYALTTGLTGRQAGILGHDVRDAHVAFKAVVSAAGLAEEWGTCRDCGGDG